MARMTRMGRPLDDYPNPKIVLGRPIRVIRAIRGSKCFLPRN
jgi:hypothetical protein